MGARAANWRHINIGKLIEVKKSCMHKSAGFEDYYLETENPVQLADFVYHDA